MGAMSPSEISPQYRDSAIEIAQRVCYNRCVLVYIQDIDIHRYTHI